MASRKILTLCIVQQGNRVLLGLKKKGFGKGRWNGFGGKVKEKEDVESAARREVFEEAGIVPGEMQRKGVLEFDFKGGNETLEVHVFSAFSFEGEAQETEEMRPQWFSVREIPFEEMWPDDKLWFPLFLEGKSFRGKFLFEDENTIKDHVLVETNRP